MVVHLSASFVFVVCNTRICNVAHQGAACGGPVVLHPIRATPCYTVDLSILFCEQKYLSNTSSNDRDCYHYHFVLMTTPFI